MLKHVKELRREKSYKNNNWAIKERLNAWREFVGKEILPIHEMSYPDLAKVLTEFFLCKDLGNQYSFGSIRNFHKSFNKILKNTEKMQISKNEVSEELLNIEMNRIHFLEVIAIVLESMEQSRDNGVNIGHNILSA